MRGAFRYLAGLFGLAVFLTVSSAAQARDSRPGPRLQAWVDGIRSEDGKRDVRFAALDIDVRVRGNIAETVLTATFANPNPQQLEGQFSLTMPAGSVVSGYALDINGQMIEGVLETRYRAQEAYQRRVTARIDPGLVEVDHSDRFETRVYPILPNGSRTIRLRFVSPFDPETGYVLPLRMATPIARFSLDIDGDPVRITFPQSNIPAGVADDDEFEAENVRLDRDLVLMRSMPGEPLTVSRHRDGSGDFFFEIDDSARAVRSAGFDSVHIFWDRSVSRIDDEREAEARLAAEYAGRRGAASVSLTLFDSGGAETETVALADLIERLGRVRYRGGTSYAVLDDVTIAAGAACLMFSDGRVTIDDRAGFALACPVSTVASGPERERPWLRDFAERSGGTFVELDGMDGVSDALAALSRPAPEIISVTDSAGAGIEIVRLAAPDDRIRIIGPLPEDGIVLLRTTDRSAPRRYRAPASPPPLFAGPGALWASHRIGVTASERAPDELAAMARRYNVATPQASFIVLDTPQDYVTSDIPPPPSYPEELMAQYAELREAADAQMAQRREGRMDQVVSLWQQTVAWWEADYDGEAVPLETIIVTSGRGGETRDDSVPPPPPPPPPPIPAPPPVSQPAPEQVQEESQAVIVTGSRVSNDGFAADAEADGQGRLRAGLTEREGAIEVREWDPERRYIAALEAAGREWETALDVLVTEHGDLPVFWFDVSEWHWLAGRHAEARRAVEAALDLPTRDNQTLAIAAARLGRYGDHDRAVWLFERLVERETDRPQPLRTLALQLIDRANAAADQGAARTDLTRAIDLLNETATGIFDVTANGIETTALVEANTALAQLQAIGGQSDTLDERLIRLLDSDFRVVMEWNTPRTDLDLWITEPSEFQVGYPSRLSPHGGRLTADVTNGYGPEEYMIRRAQDGAYAIEANVFSGDRANPNGPSRLTMRIYRNYGRQSQSSEVLDIEMESGDRARQDIATVTIE